MPYPTIPRKPKRLAQGQIHQVLPIPPSSLGLNTIASFAEMLPNEAIQMDNLISGEGGLAMRSGFQEHASNIGGDSTRPVRTIMVYNSAPANATVSPELSSEMFAANDSGIYDVTTGGDMTAVAAVQALSGTVNAGKFSYVNFTASGGTQYLVACSEIDGAYIYNGTTWFKMVNGGSGPGHIGGPAPDPADWVFVCAWKNRLLFVERGSTNMWSLDPGAVGGSASQFDFGPVLPRGGALLGLANWTNDAGQGVDDRLVVMGSAGDLAVYEGTDPTDANAFALVGTWFIGQPPTGRRNFTTSGGNIYVMTAYGILPVSEILQGGLQNLLTSGTDLLVQLRKIQGALNNDFRSLLYTDGWELQAIPGSALLMILRPVQIQNEFIQYAFQQHDLAWSRFTGIPMLTLGQRLNDVYAGTENARVLKVLTGTLDDVAQDGSGGEEIRSILTPAFQSFGAPGLQKQALMLRVLFTARTEPAYLFDINVDYSLNSTSLAPASVSTDEATWDTSLWDFGVWSGASQAYAQWRSTDGLGEAFTPTLFISTQRGGILTSINIMLKQGGPF